MSLVRRIVRGVKKGVCSTCAKARYPQLEAAAAGHVGCLTQTLEPGGLNVRDEFNASAMHMAARKGQIAVLMYLIQSNIVNEVARAANGATPAHDAAGTGYLDCLRYLIMHSNCSSHDRDLNGSTPLHWAAQFGHLNVVSWLVTEGNAQLDAITKTGVTPFHLAASKGHLVMLKWLTNYAYKVHPNPMRLINSRARNGATPIYFAAQEGHVEIVQWLSEKAGADPLIFSGTGMAPLHAAAQEGHTKCVQYLFKYGVDISAGGLRSRQDGASALHYAACQGHEEIVSWLLLQRQCSGVEKDFVGSTPVHDAADEGRVKILQVFYNHGVNMALTNAQGDTPLDLASCRAMKVCVQFLEMALKNKLPRSPTPNTSLRSDGESAQNEDDELLINEIDDFYGSSAGSRGSGKSGRWETFRDLMESEDLLVDDDDDVVGDEEVFDELGDDVEEEKRKRLREQMRKEEEMKKKLRMEKMKSQREEEDRIRANLLIEEQASLHSLQDTGYVLTNKFSTHGRPLSMPPALASTEDGEEHDAKRNKKFFNRFLRKSTNSDSYLERTKSSTSVNEDAQDKPENRKLKNSRSTGNLSLIAQTFPTRIISPPPAAPKVKEAPDNVSSELAKSKQKQENNLMKAEMLLQQSEGNDSDTASVESGHSRSSAGSSGKKRRAQRGEASPRHRRHHKPGSSPPLPRRARVRQLTPMVKTGRTRQPVASPRRLHYDESLPGQISPRHTTPSPTVSPFSSTHSSKSTTPSSSFRKESASRPQHKRNSPNSPYDFMQALNTAIETTSTHPPRVMRQNGVDKSNDDSQSPGSVSPTLLEIENQLQAMQTMVNQRDSYPRKHYTSPVKEEDDEEEEDDDSEDDDETSTESSSEEDVEELIQLNMIKPQYRSGENTSPNRKLSPAPLSGGVINRGRLVQRRQVYRPKLFSRRRLSRLDTIVEEVEERFHTGTPEERAEAFWSLRLQRKLLKGWLSYIDFTKVAYQNAEVMFEKLQKDQLATVLHGWRKACHEPDPAKELTLEESIDEALDRVLTLTNFFTAQSGESPEKTVEQKDTSPPKAIAADRTELRVTKEKEYLMWLNKHLEPIGQHADDLSKSVENGVLVLLALGQASGQKVPRYHQWPILSLQRMSNWKLVTDFMKGLGINVRGIEPEDLTNGSTACLHNMLSNILKWDSSQT